MSLSRSCRCTVLQKLQQALSPYLHYDRAIVSEMLAIAVPLIFSNILQQFYNTVDAFVLGHLQQIVDIATFVDLGDLFFGQAF